MSNDYFKNLTLLGFSPIQAEHIGGGKWQSWTPTYGGQGGMEFNSVATYASRYRVSGWDLHVYLFAVGTTAVTKGKYISATLPAGLSVRADAMAIRPCIIFCQSGASADVHGVCQNTGSELRFYRNYLSDYWTLGSDRRISLMATLELTA